MEGEANSDVANSILKIDGSMSGLYLGMQVEE